MAGVLKDSAIQASDAIVTKMRFHNTFERAGKEQDTANKELVF